MAQLLATSLWFSANSAAIDLMQQWQITVADIGWITNAVQAGFIIGTFVFAYTEIADRFKASHIFVCSALLGAFLISALHRSPMDLWTPLFTVFSWDYVSQESIQSE